MNKYRIDIERWNRVTRRPDGTLQHHDYRAEQIDITGYRAALARAKQERTRGGGCCVILRKYSTGALNLRGREIR